MTGHRRGSVTIAVLLFVVIGVAIAASVLATADAAATATASEQSRAQARALAWSGLQAVMAELADQRDSLLDGELPDLTPEWALYTTDGGDRGVIRLIDLAPDDPSLLAVAENAKLDLNGATEAMLLLVPGLGQGEADAIIRQRNVMPFQSVEQLAGLEEISGDSLYPSLAAADLAGAQPSIPGDTGPGEPTLHDLLTVYAFDPNVQLGLEGDEDARGSLRINLQQSWSDDLDLAIDRRFGEEIAVIARELMEYDEELTSDGAVLGVLIERGVPAESWSIVFDAFTTSSDQYLPGRVDLNRASAAVLACIPGVSPEAAAEIVASRDTIAPDERRSIAWPVISGILTPEQMRLAIDHLTTRSTQWRVQIEVGVERGDAGFADTPDAPMTLDDLRASWEEPDEGFELQHRMVVEAVIDVASMRPRIAYLRDVTLLETVRLINASAAENEPASDSVADELEPLPAEDEPVLNETPFAGDLEFRSRDGGEREANAERSDPPEDSETRGPEADTTSEGVDRRIGRWTTRKAGDR